MASGGLKKGFKSLLYFFYTCCTIKTKVKLIQTKKIEMKEIIDVNTGEVAVRSGEFILRAIAIVSCVVVAAYDSKAKIAGMIHIMLSGHAPE